MTDAPSDRGSLTGHGIWSEPQADWLPITRAVFRFAITHSDGWQSTETFQDDPNPFSIEAFQKFKSLQDKADADIVHNTTDPLSLYNLTTSLRDISRAHRAEIDLDDGNFTFSFDWSAFPPTCIVGPPAALLAPVPDQVEIDPRLELEREAYFNNGHGLYRISDEEAKQSAQQLEAVRLATNHVWNRLMLPAFARLVSAGRVKLYARVQSRVAQFQQLPADLWSKLTIEHWRDWQDGTARDPEGDCYYSLHAADILPKVSPMQASTIAAETVATKTLAAELVRNPNLSRRQASAWCMTNGHHFPETGRPFQDRIWPDARAEAGLPKLAPPGRKKSTH
jgi:hypothetical protein